MEFYQQNKIAFIAKIIIHILFVTLLIAEQYFIVQFFDCSLLEGWRILLMGNIKIDGRTFRTINEAANFYRTTCNYINKALREGTVPEFDKHKRIGFKKPPVTETIWGWDPMNKVYVAPDGHGYSSKRQMCYAYGMDINSVLARLKNGADLETALTAKSVKSKDIDDTYGYDSTKEMYTIDRSSYFKSVKVMCKHYDMPIIWYRIGCQQGVDHRYLVDNVPRITLTINGVKYRNLADMHKKLGFGSITSVYLRILNESVDFEQAVKEATAFASVRSHKYKNDVRYRYSETLHIFEAPNGKTFRSFHAMCLDYKVSHSSVERQIKKGFSLSEAFDIACDNMKKAA